MVVVALPLWVLSVTEVALMMMLPVVVPAV
jgi:hypothetical protein